MVQTGHGISSALLFGKLRNPETKLTQHYSHPQRNFDADQIFETIAAASSMRVRSPANEYNEPLVLISLEANKSIFVVCESMQWESKNRTNIDE